LFGAFLGAGFVVLLFTLFTVNYRSESELQKHHRSTRAHIGISYWDQHGYLSSAGLPVRKLPPPSLEHYLYRSSTGTFLVSGFLVQKIYGWFNDGYAWHAVAVHHQFISLLVSALLAVVAFRIASRLGVRTFHAFTLAVVTQVVYFTFPENLELYWEMSEMPGWMLLVLTYVLFDERTIGTEPSRRTTIIRSLLIFVMACLSVTTTPFFVAAYLATRLLLHGFFPGWKSFAAAMLIPAALALLMYKGQTGLAEHLNPKLPIYGSTFIFRSGFDGSPRHYTDHSDILYGRRPNALEPRENEDRSLRRPVLFVAGGLSILALVIAFARGVIPILPILVPAGVGGAYALYAGILSQSIVIHPYLYDGILVLPLILALFTGLPALLELLIPARGVFVLLATFAGFIHAGANLREYAVRYPQNVTTASSPATKQRTAAAAAAATTYGTWKAVAYARTNFTAHAAEWVVDQDDQKTLSYSYIGPKTMMVSFLIQDTDVTAPSKRLQITIPDGKIATSPVGTMCRIDDAGSGVGGGFVFTQANRNLLIIQRMDAKPWKKTAGHNTLVFGSITFEVR
jgi:hypothetical protein